MPVFVKVLGVDETVAALLAAEGRVKAGVARATFRLGLEVERKAKELVSGVVLNVGDGTLRRSINTREIAEGGMAGASVGTTLGYARYQEFGVPHSWLIRARTAKALRFTIGKGGFSGGPKTLGGEAIFRKWAMHGPLQERSFLRRALASIRQRAPGEIGAAVAAALEG